MMSTELSLSGFEGRLSPARSMSPYKPKVSYSDNKQLNEKNEVFANSIIADLIEKTKMLSGELKSSNSIVRDLLLENDRLRFAYENLKRKFEQFLKDNWESGDAEFALNAITFGLLSENENLRTEKIALTSELQYVNTSIVDPDYFQPNRKKQVHSEETISGELNFSREKDVEIENLLAQIELLKSKLNDASGIISSNPFQSPPPQIVTFNHPAGASSALSNSVLKDSQKISQSHQPKATRIREAPSMSQNQMQTVLGAGAGASHIPVRQASANAIEIPNATRLNIGEKTLVPIEYKLTSSSSLKNLFSSQIQDTNNSSQYNSVPKQSTQSIATAIAAPPQQNNSYYLQMTNKEQQLLQHQKQHQQIQQQQQQQRSQDSQNSQRQLISGSIVGVKEENWTRKEKQNSVKKLSISSNGEQLMPQVSQKQQQQIQLEQEKQRQLSGIEIEKLANQNRLILLSSAKQPNSRRQSKKNSIVDLKNSTTLSITTIVRPETTAAAPGNLDRSAISQIPQQASTNLSQSPWK